MDRIKDFLPGREAMLVALRRITAVRGAFFSDIERAFHGGSPERFEAGSRLPALQPVGQSGVFERISAVGTRSRHEYMMIDCHHCPGAPT